MKVTNENVQRKAVIFFEYERTSEIPVKADNILFYDHIRKLLLTLGFEVPHNGCLRVRVREMEENE